MTTPLRPWIIRVAGPSDAAGLNALLPSGPQPGDSTGDGVVLVAVASEAPGSLLGCVRLRHGIGLDVPRYWYHVGRVVHAAAELELFHQQRTLLLANDHTGADEIADLRCDSRQLSVGDRESVLASLITAARLWLARIAGEASGARTTIVELPGVRDLSGQSPFWQGLGRHFYAGDPEVAQARFGDRWRTYVAALLPRHPLIVSFLSEPAQRAIGVLDPAAGSLAALLREQGFSAGEHVTLHDAGPVYESRAAVAADERSPTLRKLTTAASVDGMESWWLLDGDRCVAVAASPTSGGLAVPHANLASLGQAPDSICWAAKASR